VADVSLRSPESITVGLELPPGQKMVHWTVNVSRTFRPANFGSEDMRELGAMVAAEFTGSGERFRQQQHPTVLKPCLL